MNKPEGPSETKTRKPPPAPNQQQTADYIAEVAFDLSRMADAAGLPFLRYLLKMVTEEAMRDNDKPRRRRTDKQ